MGGETSVCGKWKQLLNILSMNVLRAGDFDTGDLVLAGYEDPKVEKCAHRSSAFSLFQWSVRVSSSPGD